MSRNLHCDIVSYDYPGYGLTKYQYADSSVICRGTPNEETVLQTAYRVVEYVFDTLRVDPRKLILYGMGVPLSVDLVTHSEVPSPCSQPSLSLKRGAFVLQA